MVARHALTTLTPLQMVRPAKQIDATPQVKWSLKLANVWHVVTSLTQTLMTLRIMIAFLTLAQTTKLSKAMVDVS